MGRSKGAVRAIGLMSGASLDGGDVALLMTDGEAIQHIGPTGYRRYSEAERDLLHRALTARRGQAYWRKPTPSSPACRPRQSRPSLRLSASTRPASILSASTARPCCTSPAERLTVQVGDGAALARQLALPVVYDFRAADVAAGGQGAPLVPVYHYALARTLERPHPIAVLNVGGVANVTFVDGGDPIACDTGPGNALIDDFMRARTGAPLDRDGDQGGQGPGA